MSYIAGCGGIFTLIYKSYAFPVDITKLSQFVNIPIPTKYRNKQPTPPTIITISPIYAFSPRRYLICQKYKKHHHHTY